MKSSRTWETENAAQVHYRTELMWDVLRKVGRTHFEEIVDFGCGDGAILRLLMQKVGAKRAKGMDLNVSELHSDTIGFHRGNLLDHIPDEQYELVVSNQVFEHIHEPWLPKYLPRQKNLWVNSGSGSRPSE